MSITYNAFCIIDILEEDEADGRLNSDSVEWFSNGGVTLREPIVIPRWPTPQEIVKAIVQSEHFSVSADQEFVGDNGFVA